MARRVFNLGEGPAVIGLAISATLGVVSMALMGWVALFYLDFGPKLRGGVFNSQPVVLAMILGPVLLPLFAWMALKRQRYPLSVSLSFLALAVLLLRLLHWSGIVGRT